MEAAAEALCAPISCARMVSEDMIGLEFTVSSERAHAYSSTSPIFGNTVWDVSAPLPPLE